MVLDNIPCPQTRDSDTQRAVYEHAYEHELEMHKVLRRVLQILRTTSRKVSSLGQEESDQRISLSHSD